MNKAILYIILFIQTPLLLIAQERTETLKNRIIIAESTIPGFSEVIDISVNQMEMKEMLYSVAASAKVNFVADDKLTQKISGNFSGIKLSDLLLFLAVHYNLDFRITGEIIYIFPYDVPKVSTHEINLSYNDTTKRITLDLKNDTIGKALKQLSLKTNYNFQYDNVLYHNVVTCFLKEATIEDCVNSIAIAANLKAIKIDSTLYKLERRDLPVQPANVNSNTFSQSLKQPSSGEPLIRLSSEGLFVSTEKSDLSVIISKAAELTKSNHIFLSEIKGSTTLNSSFENFESLLTSIFYNTGFTFQKQENIYLIGSRQDENLRTTKLYNFRNRTLTGVTEQIPAELRKGVEIKSFQEMNSIILSGSGPATNEVIQFLEVLDKKIPVVDIEVYITDIRNSRTVSTGIKAGLSSLQSETAGSVYPSADIHLNSITVNEIMAGITRLGLLNLGRVGPAFFLKLKLLEESGALNIRSTPRLATLNGHEAKMSIGRTEYYLEIQNNVIGTQNPQNLISQQYKSVNADLSLIINPSVSANDDITLDVQVRQSNFTERISPNAPPGTISRDFHSLLRVHNGEMVVLGGLEEDTKSQTSDGLPLLSRIPVLKWIFSNRSKGKSKSRLTIFIRPTVIYN